MSRRALRLHCLAVAAASVYALPLHAEDLPSHFVPEDECMTRKCECEDLPMMEVFQANQVNALGAWREVRDAIYTDGGPRSMEEAVALFNSKFAGDPQVGAQFMSCDGYDPNVNRLSKIAGITGIGQAALDPCFCNAFCEDIVDSTVNHEMTHAPTLLLGFANVLDSKTACKLGVLPDSYCGTLDPRILADSEIISYSVGIASLQSSIDDLRESDPSNPDMACTWEPLPSASQNRLPPPTPEGFWDRLKLLAERFVGGR